MEFPCFPTKDEILLRNNFQLIYNLMQTCKSLRSARLDSRTRMRAGVSDKLSCHKVFDFNFL